MDNVCLECFRGEMDGGRVNIIDSETWYKLHVNYWETPMYHHIYVTGP